MYQKTKFFHVFKHFIWSEIRGIISTYMDNNLSCFFLQQGYSKKLLWFMVAPGKVRTLIVFLLDILYSRKPDKMESPIIKVVLFFQVSCIGHSWFRQGGSFLDVTNNSLCLDCKDFIFSIKTIS